MIHDPTFMVVCFCLCSLTSLFDSLQFRENITSFQQLLAEGVFDISSGTKAEDCKTLKRLALSNLSKSKWVEHYHMLKVWSVLNLCPSQITIHMACDPRIHYYSLQPSPFWLQNPKNSSRASVISEPNVTASSNKRLQEGQNKKFPGWLKIISCVYCWIM